VAVTLQHVATGGPAGDRVFALTFEDGRLTDTAVRPDTEPDPDAEVTVTTPYDDVRLLAAGDLDLSVAVMQGRAKVAGSTAALVAVLPATRGGEFRSALSVLLDQADAPTSA
jgi:SCP-2 sterol transfer family